MTSISLLPVDVLSTVFGLLSVSTDLIAFKEVSTVFWKASNAMKIKIACMSDKTQTSMSQLRFTNGSSPRAAAAARSNKIREFKSMSCANSRCCYITREQIPASPEIDFVEWMCGRNIHVDEEGYPVVWYQGRPGHKLRAVGLTTFYWPKELTEPHDSLNDPYGPNFECTIRMGQCERGPSVTRVVPYCMYCMNKYMNFGTREDGLEVPQANTCGFINV